LVAGIEYAAVFLGGVFGVLYQNLAEPVCFQDKEGYLFAQFGREVGLASARQSTHGNQKGL
jgi:hypothetical protein